MKTPRGASDIVAFTCLLVLVLGLVTTVFLTTPVTEYRQGFDWDGSFYAVMAGTTVIFPDLAERYISREAPYCHRILTPYLASLLPLPTLMSFQVLAYSSNVLSLLLFFLFLRKIGFSERDCFLGILLYAGTFWTLKFSFYSPAMIDYQTQLLLFLILYFTVTQRYVLVGLILSVSMLQKESFPAYIVFCAFAFLQQQKRPLTRRADLLLAFITVPPLATFLLVRLIIPQANGYTPLRIFYLFLNIFHLSFWSMFCQAIFSGTGMLIPLLLIHRRPWQRFLRKNPEWLVYLCLSTFLLFGGIQKARYFLYGLPLIVPLALCVLQDIERRISRRTFWLWFSIYFCIHVYVGNYLTPMGAFKEYLARMVPFISKGESFPFLIRNGVLAMVVILMTEWLLHTSGTSKTALLDNRE